MTATQDVATTQDVAMRVAPEYARTWLLRAATRPPEAEARQRADAVVLDLEDGVPAAHKDAARVTAARWFAAGGCAWVRINAVDTPHWRADIAAVGTWQGVQGVMLAKSESGEHVARTRNALGDRLPVIALIESALGVEEAVRIAQVPGVFRLAFGTGDYRRDTGTAATDLAMAYPRSRLVIASRIATLPGPIDGPTLDPDHDVVRARTRTAIELGMTGKLTLDETQAPVINQAASPSTAEVTRARRLLRSFEDRGGDVADGSELPALGRSRRVCELADAYGLG
ncbi:aldolase/citrate lyase family protein [Aldersonia sp. NBC_00410]|uniref:HpcH/HpaI aldolase/citrate lyase family protein n=1 Tax=Aldersonia sp. NBC_00410 TaxID=2975954 RepID=UPI0022517B1D|nr:aldolase/citrate lyase family protein [Aldersonia sp. NBC_00410]MCX5045092.1 aldolase/citrate lyase family protein [Aldersonia sp. NBC_00410]